MTHRLDYKTAAEGTVADILLAPLLQREEDFRIVDVGARNGMLDVPPSYAAHANFIGFEPNVDEYEKLLSGTTDAAKHGFVPPRWKTKTYYPYALWSSPQIRPFKITAGAGTCTLMDGVSEAVTQRMYLQYPDERRQRPFYNQLADIRDATKVECRRLDELIESDRPIDYLKLDVEGAELEALKGAENLFAKNRVLFVKTEFVMVPYYDEHPLFGHQQALLERWRMRFLGFDLAHVHYTRDQSFIPPAVDRRLIHAGDAFFALDPDRNRLTGEDLHRMGIMCIVHGFVSFGLSLIRDGNLLSVQAFKAIEMALARVPLRRRARYLFEQFPYFVAARLNRLAVYIPRGRR